MARLQLNKSSLAKQTADLAMYRRFLPSLDLKRQQLMAERAKAKEAQAAAEREIAKFRKEVGETLPMLANRDVDLSGIARLSHVELGTENLVGTRLPVLERIEVEVTPYALLAKPHWVDKATALMRDMLELRVRLQIARRRLTLLDKAVDTITQRVNLFDKVLIPRTRQNIKKISIYLSDEEMAAVVRSKLAKKKHAKVGAR